MRMQAMTRKTRILDVVYNASNNELVGSLPVPNADPDVMRIASLLHHMEAALISCMQGHASHRVLHSHAGSDRECIYCCICHQGSF